MLAKARINDVLLLILRYPKSVFFFQYCSFAATLRKTIFLVRAQIFSNYSAKMALECV